MRSEPPRPPRRRLTSSAEWIAHFRANAARPARIAWDAGAGLTAEQQAILIPSLQAWQSGESGTGTHLRLAAGRYVVRSGDHDFLLAARSLFIAEEQRHGALLGAFLRWPACIEREWTDSLFRLLRHRLASLELFTTAMIVAETLATVYSSGRASGERVGRAAGNLPAAAGRQAAPPAIPVRAVGDFAPRPEPHLAADHLPVAGRVVRRHGHVGVAGAPAGAGGGRIPGGPLLEHQLAADAATVAANAAQLYAAD